MSRSGLPGIGWRIDLVVGRRPLQLFERRCRRAGPTESTIQFQHVCLSVDDPDELTRLRSRWIELYQSGRYVFTVHQPPTGVVTDDNGVQSFYAFDVNGLELEFTFMPTGTS